MWKAIRECITGSADKYDAILEEKCVFDSDSHASREDQIADSVMSILRKAEKNGQELQDQVKGIVHEAGWTEELAKAVLYRLESVVRQGAKLVGAMDEAYGKAVGAAIEFAQEHPVYATLIALGVLVVMLPWVIEALGFAAEGPVEGSFAALWQSRYAGYVPKGSLFSYFQRLGMTWKRGTPLKWAACTGFAAGKGKL